MRQMDSALTGCKCVVARYLKDTAMRGRTMRQNKSQVWYDPTAYFPWLTAPYYGAYVNTAILGSAYLIA